MRAILPYRHTWISQGINGSYSHKGTKAIDFGSLAAYKDYNLYAPFDGTVVWSDAISKGGAIAFQSDEPVEWADGSIDFMTVITGHDNSRPVAGKKFTQGQLYSHMGTAGNVAKHSHLEVQRGKFVKPTSTIPQEYGNVYKFVNTVEPYKALFITDDTVICSVAEGSVVEYPWVKESEARMNLIKLELDKENYDYTWSVSGEQYGHQYDITTMGGHLDELLEADGWEMIFSINGGLFYTYNNQHFANGLEKSRGVNNQDVSMTAVSDYNDCMAVACVGDELWFGKQSWIIANKLEQAYGALTGMGLVSNGKKVDMHKGFESQWNAISGRTVIGENAAGDILSYSFAGETGKSGLTGAQLQNKVLELGFTTALLLDGGGSVFRRVLKDGKLVNDISTSRKVKNALMLYRKKKVQNEDAGNDSSSTAYRELEDRYNQLVLAYTLLQDTNEDLKEKLEASNLERQNLAVTLANKENELTAVLSKLDKIREIL